MGLQFVLVLLHSCDLSYLQSVPTHSPLCRSRKWGYEQLKWASTCSPSWVYLLGHPPYLEFLLFYNASSPQRIALLLRLFSDSKSAVRKGRYDSSLWCKLGNTTALAGMLYLQECRECIWGVFDLISHDYLLQSPFLYGLYTLHLCPGTAAPRTDLRTWLCLNWPVLSFKPWKIHGATPHRA